MVDLFLLEYLCVFLHNGWDGGEVLLAQGVMVQGHIPNLSQILTSNSLTEAWTNFVAASLTGLIWTKSCESDSDSWVPLHGWVMHLS